jgi:hypothetical protein
LHSLCKNHPGFSDVTIDAARLAQLPDGENGAHVIDQFTHIEYDDPGAPPAEGPNASQGDLDVDTFDTGTVPQTRPLRTEAEAFREGRLILICCIILQTDRPLYRRIQLTYSRN